MNHELLLYKSKVFLQAYQIGNQTQSVLIPEGF